MTQPLYPKKRSTAMLRLVVFAVLWCALSALAGVGAYVVVLWLLTR